MGNSTVVKVSLALVCTLEAFQNSRFGTQASSQAGSAPPQLSTWLQTMTPQAELSVFIREIVQRLLSGVRWLTCAI